MKHLVHVQRVVYMYMHFFKKAFAPAQAIAAASIAVFRSISGKFQPAPTRPHYVYTLHDLFNTYEGLLLVSPDTEAGAQPHFSLLNRRGFLSTTASSQGSRKGKTATKSRSGRGSLPRLKEKDSPMKRNLKEKAARGQSLPRGSPADADEAKIAAMLRMLVRLWCHENTRVYTDRLTESKDRMWFLRLIETCVKYCFSGIDFTTPISTQPAVGSTATQGECSLLCTKCTTYAYLIFIAVLHIIIIKNLVYPGK